MQQHFCDGPYDYSSTRDFFGAGQKALNVCECVRESTTSPFCLIGHFHFFPTYMVDSERCRESELKACKTRYIFGRHCNVASGISP